MPLTGDSPLVVADDLAVLRRNGAFQLSLGGNRFSCDRNTLHLLDAFSTPKTMQSALDHLELKLHGASAWVEVVAQIKVLHEVGVLVEAAHPAAHRASHEKRFDSAPVHIRMLNDVARTSSFQQAIRATVTTDDVVLDIGTGTGVLAVTAALAGARHVFAVEATAMSDTAGRLVEANGVGDRVTIIEGHSYDIDLPERATVLVSEIIGDDPLGEEILPTFADARDRLLIEGARIIPSRLQVRALPVEVPTASIEAVRFTTERTAVWSERYAVDFSSLVDTSEEQAHRAHVNSHDARSWTRLAEPLLLADLDLYHALPHPIDEELALQVREDGTMSGLLVFFDADLADGTRISLHPDAATSSNSWGNLLYVLAKPVAVDAGDILTCRYHFGRGGSRFEVTEQVRVEAGS